MQLQRSAALSSPSPILANAEGSGDNGVSVHHNVAQAGCAELLRMYASRFICINGSIRLQKIYSRKLP